MREMMISVATYVLL